MITLQSRKKNKCSQLRIKISTIGCDQRHLDLFLEHKSIHTTKFQTKKKILTPSIVDVTERAI
jgi:hypothetical protein